MKKNILIITASTVKNLELAQRVQETLSGLDAKVTILNLVDLNLPLFTSVSDTQHVAQDLLKDILPTVQAAQGFVFLAPEYNGLTPPVLSNFLAWLSRSSKDWRSHVNGKHAAIGTYSAGTGLNVLQAMRMQLAYMGMIVLGRQIVSTPQKPVEDKSLNAVCSELLKFSF